MKVIVYTTPACPKCLNVKALLKQHNVDFTERNVFEDDEARERLMTEGIMSVPVVEINNELMHDFTNDELLRALGLE
ncbi:MAG: glutaredoxin family protein [Candidatus Nanoarchaeia archaeon]|jgi:glutaredoxin